MPELEGQVAGAVLEFVNVPTWADSKQVVEARWDQLLSDAAAALALVERDAQPELWAALQDELASSLVQDPLGERADNLERAIDHLTSDTSPYVLSYLSTSDHPRPAALARSLSDGTPLSISRPARWGSAVLKIPARLYYIPLMSDLAAARGVVLMAVLSN